MKNFFTSNLLQTNKLLLSSKMYEDLLFIYSIRKPRDNHFPVDSFAHNPKSSCFFLCRICIISILRFGSPNKCPQRNEQRKKKKLFHFSSVEYLELTTTAVADTPVLFTSVFVCFYIIFFFVFGVRGGYIFNVQRK